MTKENINTKTILGRHTILRKRKLKRLPLGYNKGKCYHCLTYGLWSLYIQRGKPQKAVNVSISDKRS